MSFYFYALMIMVGVSLSAVTDFLLRLPTMPPQEEEEAFGKMIRVIERINTGKSITSIMLVMTLLQTAGYAAWRIEFNINSMYNGWDWAAFFLPTCIVGASIIFITVPSVLGYFTQKVNNHKELSSVEEDALLGMLRSKLESISTTVVIILMLNMSIPSFILGKTNLN